MSGLSGDEYATFVEFIHQLADLTVDKLKNRFRAPLQVENKRGGGESPAYDPVTEADREAEKVMRDAIAASWPEHGIVGEEFGDHRGDSEFRWIIDPIDGTRAFVAGLPTWGTLIGLSHRGASVLGLMSQPFTGERFWSDADGARYRGPDGERVLQASKCEHLAEAMIATTDPYLFTDSAESSAFERVRERARMQRFGGDCYSYCLLAAGFVDVVVESGLNSYDIAALIPIVRGAGGSISTWRGGPADEGGQIVATANATLHEEVVRLLNAG